jgi:secretion/DNA translocation related TadE-like protein
VLGFVTVLLAVGGVVASVALAAVTRHRAETVADVAALAAAGKALNGEAVACVEARRIAAAHQVELLGCRLDGLDAVVEVGLRPPGRLRGLGLVHARARAGRRTGSGNEKRRNTVVLGESVIVHPPGVTWERTSRWLEGEPLPP